MRQAGARWLPGGGWLGLCRWWLGQPGPQPSGRTEMGDVVLVLLTIVVFAVFALILRGSEKL
jgi:hypothetical protein